MPDNWSFSRKLERRHRYILSFPLVFLEQVTLGFMKKGSNLHGFYFQEFTLCVAVLRLTSFGLCYCDFKKRAQELIISSGDQGTAEKGPQQLMTSLNPRLSTTDADDCNQHKIVCSSTGEQKASDVMTECRQMSSAAEKFLIPGSATAQLVDMFFYVFYLPLFVAGPMMNYDVFHKQVQTCVTLCSYSRLVT